MHALHRLLIGLLFGLLTLAPLPTHAESLVIERQIPLSAAVAGARAAIDTCLAQNHRIAVTVADRAGNVRVTRPSSSPAATGAGFAWPIARRADAGQPAAPAQFDSRGRLRTLNLWPDISISPGTMPPVQVAPSHRACWTIRVFCGGAPAMVTDPSMRIEYPA